MLYERKIVYLDYMVSKERKGNAGFIKIEGRDKTCNLTIHICNLPSMASAPAQVSLIGGGRENALCEVKIVQGRGVKCLLQQDVQDIGHTGIAYDELRAVRISIDTEQEICGIVKEPEEAAVEVAEEATAEAAKVTAEEPIVEAAEVAEGRFGAGDAVKDIGEENAVEGEHFPLHDDKWKQLWTIYPHISPFRDEREYLSVGPNDFVILPYRYFGLANNSFLLHGYHNYRHLILKKTECRGEVRYYIGVPGNFYEREKQVAVMFGFESFECYEEPTQTGDFGYYLMRVEL